MWINIRVDHVVIYSVKRWRVFSVRVLSGGRGRQDLLSQHEKAFQVDSIVLPTVLKVRLGLSMSSPCLAFSATSRWRLLKAAQWAKLGRSILHSKPPSFSATRLNL